MLSRGPSGGSVRGSVGESIGGITREVMSKGHQ